jgi:hypothetical protein
MSLFLQLAQTPSPFDIPVRNYGNTDIPANTAVVLDTTNYVNAATLDDGIGVMLPATGVAGPLAIGITMETLKAGGSAGRLRPAAPTAFGVAHNTVNVGSVVDAENVAAHEGQIVAHVAGKPQLGIALTQAADGDNVLVLLAATGANNA